VNPAGAVAPWAASLERAGWRLQSVFLDGARSYGGGTGRQTYLGCSCEAGSGARVLRPDSMKLRIIM
jgi:hypothetical protein